MRSLPNDSQRSLMISSQFHIEEGRETWRVHYVNQTCQRVLDSVAGVQVSQVLWASIQRIVWLSLDGRIRELKTGSISSITENNSRIDTWTLEWNRSLLSLNLKLRRNLKNLHWDRSNSHLKRKRSLQNPRKVLGVLLNTVNKIRQILNLSHYRRFSQINLKWAFRIWGILAKILLKWISKTLKIKINLQSNSSTWVQPMITQSSNLIEQSHRTFLRARVMWVSQRENENRNLNHWNRVRPCVFKGFSHRVSTTIHLLVITWVGLSTYCQRICRNKRLIQNRELILSVTTRI